jgi:CBS domain-containing protein
MQTMMVFQKTQAVGFLSDMAPFSFIPENVLEDIAEKIKPAHYPAGSFILRQGKSRVRYLYIILKGSVQIYYEKDNEKTMRGLLGEKDTYGGISILLNNEISVRTLEAREDSFFYLLPQDLFLETCKNHKEFSDYFTSAFGRRMLDRSYSDIVIKSAGTMDESLQFFNHPVSDFFTTELAFCDMTCSIREAAIEMTRQKRSSILVKNSEGEFVGIVTDNDLRSRVIAKGYDIERPIHEIMSPCLYAVRADALVFEALIKMMRKNIKHLAVTDPEGKVCGVVTNQNLLSAQTESPFMLMRQINSADNISHIFDKHARLPGMINSLIKSGAEPENINRLITTISDAILKKCIQFAIDELGEPPARFVFMIMGSEGRKEQTLKTDQDNAIIYEDVPRESEDQAKDYFLKLGEKVCGWLDQAGYDFCLGGIMAKNPKWNASISTWKEYFSKWIYTAKPEALLLASIFFDFRSGYGDSELLSDLRKFLFHSLRGWAGFFRHLTENALYFKPPMGFFKNFVVESKGEHRNKFDIKGAMMPIVDFARIYALKNGIEETNTLGRLEELFKKKVLSRHDYNEISQSYSFMMRLRFVTQIKTIVDEGKTPHNYINPKELSRIEQTMLKEIFKRIVQCQSTLGMDFMGTNMI